MPKFKCQNHGITLEADASVSRKTFTRPERQAPALRAIWPQPLPDEHPEQFRISRFQD